MTILIVDDEQDIREIARFALSLGEDVKVVEAANGLEGIQVASDLRPDAILMDVFMPEMDGPAVLKQLQSNPGTAEIPVIFLTARSQPAEVDQLKRLGAAGVINKPFDPMTLAEDVQAVLKGKSHCPGKIL
jgi:CheY-like chemotaxis protein